MTQSRRRAAPVALGILSLVLAGCGGGDEAGEGTAAQGEAGSGCSAAGGSIEEIAAAAQEEGMVSVYSSRAESQVQNLVDAFQEKYDVEVQLYRAGGSQVAQKLELELQSDQLAADVLHLSDSSFHALLAERGDLEKVEPMEADRLNPDFTDPNGAWFGTNVLGMPIIYNSNELTEAEAPKSYEELIDEKWRGQAVIASPLYGSSQTTNAVGLVSLYGEEYLEQLKANETMVVQAWPNAETAIISGERLVGQDASTRLEVALAENQPLGYIIPEEGVIAGPAAIGVLAGAENPCAALLYLNYVLSEEGLAHFESSWTAFTDFSLPDAILPPLDEIKVYSVPTEEVAEQTETIRTTWRTILGQ